MDIEFKSLTELYNRIKPALRAKITDIHRGGYYYIKEDDIWNYLREVKWTKSKDLNLYQMVDDVLNVDVLIIDNYLKNKELSKESKDDYISEED